MQPQFDIAPLTLSADESAELLSSQLNDNIAYGIRCNVILNRTQVENIKTQRWEAEARIGIAWQGEVRGLLVTLSTPVKTHDTIDAIRQRWDRTVTEFVTHDLTPAIMEFGSISLFDAEGFHHDE